MVSTARPAYGASRSTHAAAALGRPLPAAASQVLATTISQSAVRGRSARSGASRSTMRAARTGSSALEPQHGRLREQRGRARGRGALLELLGHPGQRGPVVALAGHLGVQGPLHRLGLRQPRRDARLGGLRGQPRGSDDVALGEREHRPPGAGEETDPVVAGLVGEQVERGELAADRRQVELLEAGREPPQVGSEAYAGVGHARRRPRPATCSSRAARRGRRDRRRWPAGHRVPPRGGPRRRGPRRSGRPRRRRWSRGRGRCRPRCGPERRPPGPG